MRHARLNDRLRERAALYALGALAPRESDTFAQHLGACPACRNEVEALGGVTSDLALAAPPMAPPAAVRARVLAAARAARSGPGVASPYHFVLTGEGTWTEISPGVLAKGLAADAGARPTTYLLRLARGARVAAHRHEAVEHCYVVEGDLHIAGRHIHAGDYHRAAPGSRHDRIGTDGGCLLLIVESPT